MRNQGSLRPDPVDRDSLEQDPRDRAPLDDDSPSRSAPGGDHPSGTSRRGDSSGAVPRGGQRQPGRDRGSLRSTLHQRGMRMTPQRQLVLDAVRELGHATPEQISHRVQGTASTVNITTVYRALDLLEELGLVRHTHLGHGAPTYSAEEHEHVHLVCHRCGSLDEVPCDLLDELASTLAEHRGFELDATHLALSGLCASCRGE